MSHPSNSGLNEDLRKQPFNNELSKMVREFSAVLQPIVETIDRFGLKARFLRKHKRDVDRFFSQVANSDFQSEIATSYQRRFQKNRDKLFTFLDFDGTKQADGFYKVAMMPKSSAF
jgi:hypothetical protein